MRGLLWLMALLALSQADDGVVDKTTRRCDFVVNNLKEAFGFDKNKANRLLLKEKFQRMTPRLERYHRGTATVMMQDLMSPNNRWTTDYWHFSNANTTTMVSGDMHLQNIGTFGNSLGTSTYNINDFDEVSVADYTVDVFRFAIGIAVNAFEASHPLARIRKAVQEFAKGYVHELKLCVENKKRLKIEWTKDNTFGLLRRLIKRVANWFDSALEAQTDLVKSYVVRNKFRRVWKVQPVSSKEFAGLSKAVKQYYIPSLRLRSDHKRTGLPVYMKRRNYFKVKDIAKRLHQGLGSLGTGRYWILLEGNSTSPWDDIILDVKRASSQSLLQDSGGKHSVISQATAELNKRAFGAMNHAQRVIEGEIALTSNVEHHNGWLRFDGKWYNVHTRSPWKDRLGHKKLHKKHYLEHTALQFGHIIANAHSRGDNDYNRSVIPWSFEKSLLRLIQSKGDSKLQGFERLKSGFLVFRRELTDLVLKYTQQLLQDYKCFVKWFKKEYYGGEDEDDDDDDDDDDFTSKKWPTEDQKKKKKKTTSGSETRHQKPRNSLERLLYRNGNSNSSSTTAPRVLDIFSK